MAETKRDILKDAYAILQQHGPMRGSDLGWMLWGKTTECANRGTGSHGHNKFCRAAGKVLRRLQAENKAGWRPRESYSEWYAI